jgi:hypothetical protein
VLLAIYNRTGDETPVDGTLTKLEDVVDPTAVIKDSKKTIVKPEDVPEPKAEPKEADEESPEVPVDPQPQTPDNSQPIPGDFIPDDFIDHPDDTSLEDIMGEPAPQAPASVDPTQQVMPIQ